MMEKTLMTEVLGNSPVIKVIDYLITGRHFDCSISGIEKGAGVGWTTLHRVLPKLEKTGVIKHTRNVGRAKMYQINEDNFIASQLIALHDSLLEKSLDEIIEKEGKEIKIEN